MNTRRTVLAGLAGLAGAGLVPRLMAAQFTPAALRGDEVDFGMGTMARVLAPAGGAGTPALFLCGGSGDAALRAAGLLATQCAAAGFTAITLDIPAARGAADGAWLPQAARWVKDNQSSGRLAPEHVFLGGEGEGAAGAFAWAADFRRALGSTRLRAVVGLNPRFANDPLGPQAGVRDRVTARVTARATEIAALTRDDATSLVLISEGGADDALELGSELAVLRAPFELHRFAGAAPGSPADAMSLKQLGRSLHQPATP